MTPQRYREDPTAFILRTVDGADRPIVVEKVFALWMGNVVHLLSANSTRDRFFFSWPSPGEAWQDFKDPILGLVERGELVMCANTDPPDHPEYHLTQGHADHQPFSHGPTPMVLRYLATPAGSTAWRQVLDERRRREQEQEAEQARYDARLQEAVRAQLAVKPMTAGRLARKLSARRRDVHQAIAALTDAQQITYAGRSFWRKTLWKASATDLDA
jgi:hypothetical protein